MKQYAGAAERNRSAIAEMLSKVLDPTARVLEIGSGTGQHAAHFTEQMPSIVWQPSDARPEALASIDAYRAEYSRPGFLPPLALDVLRTSDWPSRAYDAVFSANVIHIAPWSVCVAIVEGAARVLLPGGKLVFYGPFRFFGELSPESNRAFDARLRTEDPRFGIRDVGEIAGVARPQGFAEPAIHAMPANNHVIVFEKSL